MPVRTYLALILTVLAAAGVTVWAATWLATGTSESWTALLVPILLAAALLIRLWPSRKRD